MCHKIPVVSERKAAFAASACPRSSRGTECEVLLRWENWDPLCRRGLGVLCCIEGEVRLPTRSRRRVGRGLNGDVMTSGQIGWRAATPGLSLELVSQLSYERCCSFFPIVFLLCSFFST